MGGGKGFAGGDRSSTSADRSSRILAPKRDEGGTKRLSGAGTFLGGALGSDGGAGSSRTRAGSSRNGAGSSRTRRSGPRDGGAARKADGSPDETGAGPVRIGFALVSTGDGPVPTGADLNADDLVTHGVVVGMTGSGKTGLVTVLVEEALRAESPVLLLDINGDLANLKLAFPSFDAKHLAPWVEAARGDDGVADKPLVEQVAATRKKELTNWSITERDLAHYCESTHVRVITPGSDAGEPLHLLSALERRSARWDHDVDGARATLEAAVSMVLRLMGRDPDPAQSRAHALLTAIAERRHAAKQPADLASLLPDVIAPPFAEIGALPVETYLGEKARAELAADLNTLIASSSRWARGRRNNTSKRAGARWKDKSGGRVITMRAHVLSGWWERACQLALTQRSLEIHAA